MAKKKQNTEVEVTPGGRRICPDCKLSFRDKELFDQHRSLGCEPAKPKGETWSDKEPGNAESN